MAKMVQPVTVAVELTPMELETIRVGLRHTITYGTVAEEDRARELLGDLDDAQN
ncbi:hypothetical protein [Streptomyces hydrogenans]|uniref:hypothetical protein n=1 Tax=Streptomyces hydrogenans TaxID=1873719 RepID=UPI0035D8BDF3